MNARSPIGHNTQEDLEAIREGVRAVVTRFDDEYWLQRDEDREFPREFHKAMADAGCDITLPDPVPPPVARIRLPAST